MHFQKGYPAEHFTRLEADLDQEVYQGVPLADIIKRREEERRRVIEKLKTYTNKLKKSLGKVTVVLFGSYARGDFNVWSDIDVIIISEGFKNIRFPLRCLELKDPPERLSPICWTPNEARRLLATPSWKKALKGSIIISDDYNIFSNVHD